LTKQDIAGDRAAVPSEGAGAEIDEGKIIIRAQIKTCGDIDRRGAGS
jgi:hypothetical protein